METETENDGQRGEKTANGGGKSDKRSLVDGKWEKKEEEAN